MYRAYLFSSILAFALFGYAHLKGWTVMPSPAEEFRRAKEEQREYQRSGGSGSHSSGRSGGFSGK